MKMSGDQFLPGSRFSSNQYVCGARAEQVDSLEQCHRLHVFENERRRSQRHRKGRRPGETEERFR